MKRLANPQALAAASRRRDSEDNDTWLTPRWILAELGVFDLDPCASAMNPEWVCPNFYTEYSDGLRREWQGRVFMNPPYSDTEAWIEKHARHGNGISLVPASVESGAWRQFIWKKAKALFLFYGRTRFCRVDGSSTTGRPRRSVALIAWSEFDATVLRGAPFAGVHIEKWEQV